MFPGHGDPPEEKGPQALTSGSPPMKELGPKAPPPPTPPGNKAKPQGRSLRIFSASFLHTDSPACQILGL